ncbi:hypothetical protein QBC34DRAFT_469822 [Podospora aff. communis PSN243]|uniref:Uncharacterized protein n=1 Tax=Podospora aff. communis PSN243 TaxID=3040156 RepID=A0AAV9GC50_9PEZI|nr:hypothetical protein QBC34DRAFT_469822 [Podospora aff. communis PSN243]
MKWLHPLAWAAFAGLAYTEVLDLGDLKQFDPKLTALPDGIHPNAIWINPADGQDGFNVVLGPDLKVKVDGVLQGCGAADNQCYQEVVKVLREEGTIQMDKRLDKRAVLIAAATIAEVLQTGIKVIEALGAVLLAFGALFGGSGSEKGHHWPGVVASAAGKLPQATPITVSAGGSAVATITKAPIPIATVAPGAPVVTAVTTPGNGFENGDLVVVLGKDLAARLQEVMARNKDCQAGAEFDKQHPTPAARRAKRAGGTFGNVICGAQAAILNAETGGALGGFLLPGSGSIDFTFTNTEAIAAVEQIDELSKTFHVAAPLPSNRAHQLATLFVALGINSAIDDIPVGERNRIKASLVSTGGGSGGGRPGENCPGKTLVCGILENQDCAMKIVQAANSNATRSVCEDGPHKDCPCTGPALPIIHSASRGKINLIRTMRRIRDNRYKPQCNIVLSDIPSDLFSSSKMNIHNHFCESWVKDAPLKMTVDSRGANTLPEPHRKGVVAKRTPPANPSSFGDFRFDLAFKPSKDGGDCMVSDCNKAFVDMARTCRSDSSGVYMYETGSYNVGCGSFTYDIRKRRPDEPRIGEEVADLIPYDRYCYKPEELPELKGDVHDGTVMSATMFICAGRALPEYFIQKDNKTTWGHSISRFGNVPYQYNIWWKPGCKIEKNWGPTAISAMNPFMQKSGLEGNTCAKFLWENWKECTGNGGRGGNIQLGCLMYEFMASDVKREF